MTNYAHSKLNSQKIDWQILEDHLNNVAEIAAKFAKKFNCENIAYNCGILHDIGKYDKNFQQYLSDNSHAKPNHSSASIKACECLYNGSYSNSNNPFIKLYKYIVGCHHTGLKDYLNFSSRYDEADLNFEEIKNDFENIIFKNLKLNEFFIMDCPYYHILIKMLFSCLIDADYLDTENFYDSYKTNMRGNFNSISELNNNFNNYINGLKTSSGHTKLNEMRNYVYDKCVENSNLNENLYKLSAPTGIGKTLSSLAFALNKCVKYNKDRIIFVVPYTSIIDQISGILCEIFGENNVIEHHSNFDMEKLNISNDNSKSMKWKMSCENYDAPIIVTTSVQFYESFYSNKCSKLRKLHNISNSVIILDEFHLIPNVYLKECVNVINALTKYFNSSILLMSATPTELNNELLNCVEILDSNKTKEIYNETKRVNYKMSSIKKPLNHTDVANEMKLHKRALCVVNTKDDCFNIYMNLKKSNSIYLSTRLCPEHRINKINDVKARLKLNEDLYVVSTQLIEAGVDIDFPIVFRAFTGLDSIVQSAGRCNREGKCQFGGFVGIFKMLGEKIPPESELQIKSNCMEDIVGKYKNENDYLNNIEVTNEYFKSYYKFNPVSTNKIYEKMNKQNFEFNFEEVAKEFKFIQNCSKNIIVNYGKSNTLVNELKVNGPNRYLLRKLQRYTVSIYENEFDKMLENDYLEVFTYDKNSEFYIQSDLNIYNDETGLDVIK